MVNSQINKFRILERKKKLSSTVEYHLFLRFRRNFSLRSNDQFNYTFDFMAKDPQVTPYSAFLENKMLYAYTRLEGKLQPFDISREDYFEQLGTLVYSDLAIFIRLVNERRNRKQGGKFRGLDLHVDGILPLDQKDVYNFNKFFLLFKPNAFLLSEGDSYLALQEEYLPLIVAYFFIFERLDKSPGFEYNQYAPGEVNYTFKTVALKKAWKDKWRNHNFSTATFQNVSKEVQNMLLKDDKIEQLFTCIFNELRDTAQLLGQERKILPKITSSAYKNVFPVVKERVEKNLPYMNYLYLEEEEKQPEEVKEVNNGVINVEKLLERKADFLHKSLDNPEVEGSDVKGRYLNSFYEILLDIMFSQVLQELFKEYEFYHKKILTMVPAIIEGDMKALEENPNAQMKNFWEVGVSLYRLYFYLGIYKSIIGFNDFYFKGERPQGYVLTLYWRLMRMMCDFDLEIEGQELREDYSITLDVEKFPQDGVLKAKIKRSVSKVCYYPEKPVYEKEHFVYWDLKEKKSLVSEGSFFAVDKDLII